MKTSLFLLNISFQYPGGLPFNKLQERIKALESDITYMRENKQATFKNDSIYDESLWGEYSILECLYPPENISLLHRDVRKSLIKIIDRAKSTEYTNDEIFIKIRINNKDDICGLLCLHETEGIDPVYLIYHKQNWLDFHRHQMSIHINDISEFLIEVKKYFPDLFFHEHNHTSLAGIDGGFQYFRKAIINALTYLNDKFKTIFSKSNNLMDCLKIFSAESGIETSLEGDSSRKKDFSFIFEGKTVCCEPHMKIAKKDQSGTSKYYFNRIYFHPGNSEILNGKILIGHIGKHL